MLISLAASACASDGVDLVQTKAEPASSVTTQASNSTPDYGQCAGYHGDDANCGRGCASVWPNCVYVDDPDLWNGPQYRCCEQAEAASPTRPSPTPPPTPSPTPAPPPPSYQYKFSCQKSMRCAVVSKCDDQ